jgi:hypothetical protein
MKHGKIVNIFIALFAALSICTNGLMAEACLCGQACLHGLQDTSDEKVSIPFHNHCSGTACKSCHIEEGQTIKAADMQSPDGQIKTFAKTHFISVLIFISSTMYFPSKGCGFFYARGISPSSPIDHQSLPLVC